MIISEEFVITDSSSVEEEEDMGISIDEEALFDVEEHVRANADLYPLLHACLTAQAKKHEHKTLKMSIYGAKGLRRQLHGKEGQVKVLKDEGEVAKKND